MHALCMRMCMWTCRAFDLSAAEVKLRALRWQERSTCFALSPSCDQPQEEIPLEVQLGLRKVTYPCVSIVTLVPLPLSLR